jgi:hypothetical protein
MDLQKEHEVWKLLNNLTTTENGEISFKSTGDKNLDLFSTVNRDAEIITLITKFVNAWNENPEYAIKVLLNFRDIREGKGEKLTSKIMLLIIKIVHPDIYEKLIPLFIEVGCWKDLLFLYEMGIYYGTDNDIEITIFAKQLSEDLVAERPSLCAKWAPTEGCHFDRKTRVAKRIMKHLHITPKEYRKMLTDLRTKIKLVETQLSQQCTNEINFSTIPSRAHLLYKKAFLRETNALGQIKEKRTELKERYQQYLAALTKGEEKANFKGIMPHELVHALLKSNDGQAPELIESQWKSIRGEIEDLSVFDRCVSIVDVSSSMESGNSGNTPRPIDVAIALGILVSECSKGTFQHKMFTFHDKPTLADLSNFTSLLDKVRYVKSLPWGGNTDIEAVFDQIIATGTLHNLTQEQMPDRLFIFTDMQFDQVSGRKIKTFDKIKEKFKKHGYRMPQIICWNLRSIDNVVFTKDETDVCMLSGYSTPILKAFLTCQEITPLIVFLSAINHYKVPEIVLKPIDISSIDISKIESVVKKCDFNYIKEKDEEEKDEEEKDEKEKDEEKDKEKDEEEKDEEEKAKDISRTYRGTENFLTSLRLFYEREDAKAISKVLSKDILKQAEGLSSVDKVNIARQLLEMDESMSIPVPTVLPIPVSTNAPSRGGYTDRGGYRGGYRGRVGYRGRWI